MRIKDFLNSLQPENETRNTLDNPEESEKARIIELATKLQYEEDEIYNDEYDDSLDDVRQRAGPASRVSNPLASHEGTLMLYYTKDASTFEQSKRRSAERAAIHKNLNDPSITDEMIEGWASMLKRNPNALAKTFITTEWKGNKAEGVNIEERPSSESSGKGRGRGQKFKGNKHHRVADNKRAKAQSRAFQST